MLADLARHYLCLLSWLEDLAAFARFHEQALVGGFIVQTPSEIFLYWDSVLIKLTQPDVLHIPMTAA